MPVKRKSPSSYSYRAKRARMTGTMTLGKRRLMARPSLIRMGYKPSLSLISAKVNNLSRMIENKHFTWRTSANINLPHNRVTVLQLQSGGDLNPFRSVNGTDDPMGTGGTRIGDQITASGLLIRGMFENAFERSRVHYRVMLVKCSKGDTIDDATFMQNITGNKLIDQLNTERFTIIAQKMFTIQTGPPGQATRAGTNGAALTEPSNAIWYGGQGTRTFKMWIPGRKFGLNGRVTFENNSQGQVKFFDYRVVVIVYDWYGTPTGGGAIPNNNVGKVNELYTKLYFKDA